MVTNLDDRPAPKPLTGLRVLNGRPRERATPLSRALEAAGAEVHSLPLLTVEPLPEDPAQRAALQDLDQFQHVIVVSPNAADYLIEALDHWWPQTPIGIHWYAVGRGTAAVLERSGLRPRMPETGYNSEALLARPELQDLAGEKVLICRGKGGRETLPDTLESRGARVTRLELYERCQPSYGPDVIEEALISFDPQVIVVLSGETLNNLIGLGQNTDHKLLTRTVLVPVERVAEQARALGFTRVLVPDGLEPDAIVARIARFRNGPEAP